MARRIRFEEHVADNPRALMTFLVPAPRDAVSTEISPTASLAVPDAHQGLELLILPFSSSARTDETSIGEERSRWFGDKALPGWQPPIIVKMRGAEVTWRPGRAVLQCDSEQVESLQLAIIEFSYHENELRRIEEELSAAWSELEIDKRLAYEVTTTDLERSEVVGQRMDQALQRRIRHARIEPHLNVPGLQLSVAAQKLGEELREKARVEDRLEIVDGQLEVFEHVYEMCSQRMSEFRASRQEHTLEWVIIVLLAAETLLLLAEMIWTLEA